MVQLVPAPTPWMHPGYFGVEGASKVGASKCKVAVGASSRSRWQFSFILPKPWGPSVPFHWSYSAPIWALKSQERTKSSSLGESDSFRSWENSSFSLLHAITVGACADNTVKNLWEIWTLMDMRCGRGFLGAQCMSSSSYGQQRRNHASFFRPQDARSRRRCSAPHE